MKDHHSEFVAPKSMQQMTQKGHQIEEDSFSIIDREIDEIHGGHSHNKQQWQVVRRAIHTTGDFEFSDLYRFSENAVDTGIKALINGCPIVSDVTMIKSGISPVRTKIHGNATHCFISDADVIENAKLPVIHELYGG